MNRRHYFSILLLPLYLTGCATVDLTTENQERIEALENQVERQSETLGNLAKELLEKEGKYMVRHGDTLASIAKERNTTFIEIIKLNPELRHGDLSIWRPGRIIVVEELKQNKSIEEQPIQPPRD